MMTNRQAFDELCSYTLTHSDPKFIHQHVVDAFGAQNANEDENTIRLTFALVGIYLHLEYQFSPRQVQRAHVNLASRHQACSKFRLPDDRGASRRGTCLKQLPVRKETS